MRRSDLRKDSHMAPKSPYFLLAVLVATLAVAQGGAGCGSLITYRQFEILLDEAPTCFRTGCGGAASMSSSCPSSAACFPLWDLLRTQWQADTDWCAAARDKGCRQDLACRIGGWPVLNVTAVCDAPSGPGKGWLFGGGGGGGSAGGCCVEEQEPFELADWVGALCNGSQWREGFAYTAGMAPLDWEEWREPWNWTLRPQNTTRKNVSLDECGTSYETLAAIGIDNGGGLADALFQILVVWIGLIFLSGGADSGGRRGKVVEALESEVKTTRMALVGGIVNGMSYILSNFATAVVWSKYFTGYRDMPTANVGLLLCSRPSVLAYVCFLGLLSRPVSRLLGWTKRMVSRAWRRVLGAWNWMLRRPPLAVRLDEQAGDDLSELLARKLLANWALTLAVGEVFVQLVSIPSMVTAANEARSRGFYILGNLAPYDRGKDALFMYGGALVHAIFFVPSVLALLVSTLVHLRNASVQKFLVRRSRINRAIAALGRYYANRDANLAVAPEIDRRENLRQRALKGLLDAAAGKKRPFLDKHPKTRRVLRAVNRVGAGAAGLVLRVARPALPAPSSTPRPALMSGGLGGGGGGGGGVASGTAAMTAAGGAAPSVVSAGALSAAHAAVVQNLVAEPALRPLALAGRVLSVWPLNVVLLLLVRYTAAVRADEMNRRADEYARSQPPDREEYDALVQRARQLQSRSAADKLKWRFWAQGAVFACVTINYISQWFFWAGYVRTSGDR